MRQHREGLPLGLEASDDLSGVHSRIDHLDRDAALDGLGLETETLARLSADLKRVNESLWVIEDALREHERNADFGAAFVELARSVYRINDQRAELKRAVNRIFGSALVEEKSYSGDQQL